jgi:glycosyltransferase involved in cell wall biosynthesis
LGHAFPVNEILDGAAELKGDGGIGFVFFGDGQRLDEYRTSSEEREIRAKFPGRVSKSDIHAICRAADFCIYPASPGKFSCAILGNKVFDYLGAGKAIIYIGDDSAVSDVISELKAGIICRNKSPADFSRAVLALRDNPELRGRLEAGARSFRSAGYTARASAELLLGLVERSLGKSEI